MKKTISSIISRLVFLFFVLMNATIAFAQDGGGTGGGSEDGGAVTVSKSTTSTSTSTTADWYTAPWVWVVGAAVFILLLIALIRGNSSRTDVHKTTVRKDVTTD